MTGFILVKLATAAVSVGLAAGILARDHGLKANRLIAAFLFCNAWWATQEFFLYQASDPEQALVHYRLMSLGWIPLGVLCMHASVMLSTMENRPIAKLIPFLYASLAMLMPFALWTDFVIGGVEEIALGWRALFNPGMVLAYLLLAGPLVSILASWRDVMAVPETSGHRQLARIVFFGVSGALVAGTTTAIVLPMLEIESIGITTTLLAGVGLATAGTLRQFGHSLISPGALAREILDTLEDGVVLVGEEGRLRDANRAFLRMVGSSESAAIGRPIHDWIDRFPETGESIESTTFMEVRTRAGDIVPVVVSPPVECREASRFVGWAFLLRDRREIVSLQRQLVVSARLAAVGDLSKSISRSINEPVARAREELDGLSIDWQTIGDVLELADLSQACREALEEGNELIGEVVEGVERIFGIVREVGSFTEESQREAFARHPLDRIVHRAIRVARVQAPDKLRIEARLDPDVMILCHSAEVERVVINLIVNAIQALDTDSLEQAQLAIGVVAQDGRALLHVEDNGCGIEAEDIDRIFDPFFTTKPVGKGTGLGLAISYHIVKAHGGEIRVSSVPGRGTSVAVELPRAPLEVGAND